ncbi:hypothetical protein [Natronorubrum sp. DTA7]|uniref:hypothetical protein n=1 Tax=Natronorubrum sp. DTA7 TaxID=3447016 RepID=UPI003F874119
MCPLVKITEATNDRLEELQAAIRRETGRDVPKRELLERIVEDVYESKETVIELFSDGHDP